MINQKINLSRGTLVYQDYKKLIEKKIISSKNKIIDDSIQPASLDLRLGVYAYEISSSFLAIKNTVENRLKFFKKKKISLLNGYVFKKNITYLVELQENLNLSNNLSGKCNPKSSTGRLDIFCRVITDYSSEYEIINSGYKGKLYLEITTKTFDILFSTGNKLNQLRLKNDNIKYLNDKDLEKINKKEGILFDSKGNKINLSVNNGLKIKADITKKNIIIAYKAKKDSSTIIYDKINCYKIKDFWKPVFKKNNDFIIIEPNEFYILKSKEKIRILPNLAAEMLPYETDIGEFRVHYAGFFDPGFGYENKGSYAVLEIKTYEVSFVIQNGQNIARLMFDKLQKVPSKLYGKNIKSNYQNQGLALSKHFRILG